MNLYLQSLRRILAFTNQGHMRYHHSAKLALVKKPARSPVKWASLSGTGEHMTPVLYAIRYVTTSW
jgi:hypothetical protein